MTQQKNLDDVALWYKTDGWYKHLVQRGFQTVKPYFLGKTLLEVGPADGVMTELLQSCFSEMTLLEPAHAYIPYLRKQFPNASVVESMLEHFHPKKTYDTIIMAHVLEHIEKPVDALSRLKALMHNKSRLIIIVPNAYSPQRRICVAFRLLPTHTSLNSRDKSLRHQRVYDLSLLENHIHRAGLDIQTSGNILLGMDIYGVVTR